MNTSPQGRRDAQKACALCRRIQLARFVVPAEEKVSIRGHMKPPHNRKGTHSLTTIDLEKSYRDWRARELASLKRENAILRKVRDLLLANRTRLEAYTHG